MGARYTDGRNYDRGPGGHTAVSRLSPYLRRRLILEQEVVSAAVAMHGEAAAEKFIQEVFWRSYFKGWLEHRPQVWAAYRDGLGADPDRMAGNSVGRRRLEQALAGQTGLDCFDAWVCELRETGYLHNHARMWFASIWIFTFELPWRLGADFFYRHLLDGDAASNTLSWRWVAGLHTRGKPYAARADNIRKFTGQRFNVRDEDLAKVDCGLEDEEPQGLPNAQPLRTIKRMDPNRPTLLLITDEDCSPEALEGFCGPSIVAAATLETGHLRSSGPVADLVLSFERGALGDAGLRCGLPVTPLCMGRAEEIVALAQRHGATQILTAYLPVGPVQDHLLGMSAVFEANGLTLCEGRRRWDDMVWPHATAGFFKVKQQIPRFVRVGLETRMQKVAGTRPADGF